jgi:hypothetical protein
MNKIPVIGTAVVNGAHWVHRLISSVDYPVENFVIFNNNGKGELTEELDNLAKMKHPLIDRITVCHMPSNIGVSGAWNLIIKSFMNAPYWIISNHDVAFTVGFLEEMISHIEDSEVGMVHGKSGDFGIGGYDLFLIRDWVVQEYGLFDENFYPAYCEDADHIMRFIHKPIKAVKGLSRPYYHGYGTDYYETGSQTKKNDPILSQKLDEINTKNFEYMTKKWGPQWRTCWPYILPFDDGNSELGRTTYDLSYVREKHLGF